MGARHSVILILAAVATVITAAVVEGQGQVAGTVTSGTATVETVTASPPHTAPHSSGTVSVPSRERTHPKVHPTTGRRLTRFTLTFTLRDMPGHQGVFAVEYRVQVAPPAGTGASCAPPQPPPVDSGAVGALEQVKLMPPAHGWCRGTHRVTVFLERGPYCPPPVKGQPPTPCPEFATQLLDTGAAGFTVKRSATRAGSATGHAASHTD